MPARITVSADILGGKPCIAGHRVRVSDIVIWHEHQGLSAGAIVSQLPGITLADVHAALAYYYENIGSIREEIRAELAEVQCHQAGVDSVLQAKLSHAKRVS